MKLSNGLHIFHWRTPNQHTDPMGFNVTQHHTLEPQAAAAAASYGGHCDPTVSSSLIDTFFIADYSHVIAFLIFSIY